MKLKFNFVLFVNINIKEIIMKVSLTRILCTFILSVLFLTTLTGCDLSSLNNSDPVVKNQSTEEKSADESLAADSGTVGDSLQNSKWKLSLLSAKEYDKITGEYMTEEPKSGKVFLVLSFVVENISAQDDYFNRLYAKGYVDDYAVDQALLFNDIDGNSTLTDDIAAGKKLKGHLAWEVPADWQEFEFNFDESTFGDGTNKFVFIVRSSDVVKVSTEQST
ncbi:MAG TPA: hypothetical protein DD733_07530 [Clostridiales bacterium]|nr:hypothetical protein [Clostridiales bacterium]